MKVIFFEVDGVLNFSDSDAVAPSGAKGVAEAKAKALKKMVQDSGAKLVLFGSWRKNWDFNDEKCTPDGVYLNKKLDRRGLHIMDKTRDDLGDEEGIKDWLDRRPNVTEYCVLKDFDNVRWQER